jgi:hypothetical protein
MSYIPPGYVPTTYTTPDEGDTAFWGTLIEPGPAFRPSPVFPRLTDSIFFFLNEHAEPKRSNYIEPSKITYWHQRILGAAVRFTFISLADFCLNRARQLSPDVVDTTNRIHFQEWMIPVQLVTGRLGDPQVSTVLF